MRCFLLGGDSRPMKTSPRFFVSGLRCLLGTRRGCLSCRLGWHDIVVAVGIVFIFVIIAGIIAIVIVIVHFFVSKEKVEATM